MKMLLDGNKLHLRPDKLSPVVAVIEPTRVRVGKGLDLAIACVACAVKRDAMELKSPSSIRSLSTSFKKHGGM